MGLRRTLAKKAINYSLSHLSEHGRRALAIDLAQRCRPEREQQSFDCPLCGYQGPFSPIFSSIGIRFDAGCPKCNSRERHRFLKFWLDNEPALKNLGDMVHFAPEPVLSAELKPKCSQYRTAEITPGKDLQLNIEAIDLPDACLDTVMANHVLEHVDDTKALPEILRVLRKGGQAILTMPVKYSMVDSYEDPNITDPAERFRHFGQRDHVRWFGRDVESRITAAGFELTTITAQAKESLAYALSLGDTIYWARKP